jgi:hypothetical protein
MGMEEWAVVADINAARLVLRLGAHVNLEDIPTLPVRERQRPGTLEGRLGSIFVSGEDLWCRLNGGMRGQVWPPAFKHVEARTVPLNDRQQPTPSPNAIELLPHMQVECHDGFVGKLEGVTVLLATGQVDYFLVRLRNDLQDVVARPTDALAPLVSVQGQTVLLDPTWAVVMANGSTHHLALDASAEQIASALVLRDDRVLEQEIYAILGENPALTTYLSAFRVTVRDGAVTLTIPPLSPRLRASMEQVVWHISGVLAVRVIAD